MKKFFKRGRAVLAIFPAVMMIFGVVPAKFSVKAAEASAAGTTRNFHLATGESMQGSYPYTMTASNLEYYVLSAEETSESKIGSEKVYLSVSYDGAYFSLLR